MYGFANRQGTLDHQAVWRVLEHGFQRKTHPCLRSNPGNSTTLLSIDLVKVALGQFDLGPAAAMSLIYFVITLLVSWVFYTVMTKDEPQ